MSISSHDEYRSNIDSYGYPIAPYINAGHSICVAIVLQCLAIAAISIGLWHIQVGAWFSAEMNTVEIQFFIIGVMLVGFGWVTEHAALDVLDLGRIYFYGLFF